MQDKHEMAKQAAVLSKTINNLRHQIISSLPVKHDQAIELSNKLSGMLAEHRLDYIISKFGPQSVAKSQPLLIQLASHEAELQRLDHQMTN